MIRVTYGVIIDFKEHCLLKNSFFAAPLPGTLYHNDSYIWIVVFIDLQNVTSFVYSSLTDRTMIDEDAAEDAYRWYEYDWQVDA